MPEHEPLEFQFCAVCERALLVGEREWSYVAPAGDVRVVCTLCKPRAEASGWVPESLAAAAPLPSHGRRGRRFGAGRITGAAARVRRSLAPPAPPEELEPVAAEPIPVALEPEAPAEPQWEAADPVFAEEEAAELEEPEPPPPEPLTDELVVARALRVFNESEEQRQVDGLRRTLGNPLVSVQPAGDGREVALVVVAWDLSWYEWEVAVRDGEDGVTEIRKGSELAELGQPAPEWNAALGEDGQLALPPS